MEREAASVRRGGRPRQGGDGLAIAALCQSNIGSHIAVSQGEAPYEKSIRSENRIEYRIQ